MQKYVRTCGKADFFYVSWQVDTSEDALKEIQVKEFALLEELFEEFSTKYSRAEAQVSSDMKKSEVQKIQSEMELLNSEIKSLYATTKSRISDTQEGIGFLGDRHSGKVFSKSIEKLKSIEERIEALRPSESTLLALSLRSGSPETIDNFDVYTFAPVKSFATVRR